MIERTVGRSGRQYRGHVTFRTNGTKNRRDTRTGEKRGQMEDRGTRTAERQVRHQGR